VADIPDSCSFVDVIKEDYKPQKAQKYTEGRLNIKEENFVKVD